MAVPPSFPPQPPNREAADSTPPSPEIAARRALYESWVQQWGPSLYRLALRLSGRREAAEDLLQETFVEAWRGCDKLSDPQKAKGWLFQILRNRWSHYLRDSGRRLKPRHDELGLEAAASRETSPAQSTAESDYVQRALDNLDEGLKLPFLLVVMEGYSCAEAAEALKIPLGTVLSRLHRARQVLRSVLAPQHEGSGNIQEKH